MAPLQIDEEDEEDTLSPFVHETKPWNKKCIKSLVKTLYSVGEIKEDELPKKPADANLQFVAKMRQRFREVTEAPLARYARNLKPELFRRVHVGTMSEMDECHEYYRQKFEFLELTSCWHDTDRPWRKIDWNMQDIGCKYLPASMYEELGKRARDGFKVVVKVSHLATHCKKLHEFRDWWPKLYKEKYSKIQFATVAFLWQFPPSFRYERENWEALEALTEYLHSSESGCPEARHIVDFRSSGWYNAETYEFLRKKRWCLAWLHLNNESGWASDLPSGWTDRVRTTNFCFMRLFGPSGRTHGRYNKAFLHDLFNSCPAGCTSYVLFGNREEVDDPNPHPRPALVNANDFRAIFTKMDFVERIRAIRYVGDCPRQFTDKEKILLNSFYLRFSQRARVEGIRMSTPVGSTHARKYYEMAPDGKRSFEWKNPKGGGTLHLPLHDAKEDEDLWTVLRNLTGLEDLDATRQWVEECKKSPKLDFGLDECRLVNGAFLRWSERARQAGLLGTTRLKAVRSDGTVCWSLTNGTPIRLNVDELREKDDAWRWFVDLTRFDVPESEETVEIVDDATPWKDGTWKEENGKMWEQEFESCAMDKPTDGIPDEYRAAGLIFYSRDADTGDVAHVLLGIEERHMDLWQLGPGHGKSTVPVVVFPQGKVEPPDEDYLATAKREFEEETGDPTDLRSYVKSKTETFAVWYPEAKMGVAFCEVPISETKKAPPARARKVLKPVWIEIDALRKILAEPVSAKLQTDYGSFPLFPMARRFFCSPQARLWMEMDKTSFEKMSNPTEEAAADVDEENKEWQEDSGEGWSQWKNYKYDKTSWWDGEGDAANTNTKRHHQATSDQNTSDWQEPAWKRAKYDDGNDWSKKGGEPEGDEPEAGEPEEERVKLGAWRGSGTTQRWNEWERWESNTEPGKFYYRNTETNDMTIEPPPPLADTWELIREENGDTYYYNKFSGDVQSEAPELK